ncbi:MAG TPA: anti-sigma factor [bacterium]|nr:anti-sigma factor [bacterium]
MTHEEAREFVAAYALDALAPDEVLAFEAHLTACEQCRQDLAELRNVAAELATGPSQVAPPEALRAQILSAVRPASARPAARWPWMAGLAAAAALILLLGAQDLWFQRRTVTLTHVVEQQSQLLGLLTSPSSREVGLAGAARGSVHLVFNPVTHQGVLVASGLQPLGPGRVYQVWLIAGPRPESAGVFQAGQTATTFVGIGGDFARYRAIAISVEPGPGGSPQPTTTPILTGAFPGAS